MFMVMFIFFICSSDSELGDAIVEVIDHHLQQRPSSPSCPVTVETVGSCATLVTERIAQKAPDVLDQQVAQLLYGERHGDVDRQRGMSSPCRTSVLFARHCWTSDGPEMVSSGI